MAWIAQDLLTAIGAAAVDDCITEAQLVAITCLDARQVENSALVLRKHGLIERIGTGCHRLTDAGRAALAEGVKITSGPRGEQPGTRIFNNTLRTRVWLALRIRRKISMPEIIMLVARGGEGEKDIESNVGRYLRVLARAGYVSKMPRREPGVALTSNGFARWMLINDTGSRAPVWRPKADTVYDPNTETETPLNTKKGAASCG